MLMKFERRIYWRSAASFVRSGRPFELTSLLFSSLALKYETIASTEGTSAITAIATREMCGNKKKAKVEAPPLNTTTQANAASLSSGKKSAKIALFVLSKVARAKPKMVYMGTRVLLPPLTGVVREDWPQWSQCSAGPRSGQGWLVCSQ